MKESEHNIYTYSRHGPSQQGWPRASPTDKALATLVYTLPCIAAALGNFYIGFIGLFLVL